MVTAVHTAIPVPVVTYRSVRVAAIAVRVPVVVVTAQVVVTWHRIPVTSPVPTVIRDQPLVRVVATTVVKTLTIRRTAPTRAMSPVRTATHPAIRTAGATAPAAGLVETVTAPV